MKFKILEELSENEIELLFEGVSYYEIIKADDVYIHYMFDDFGLPIYYFITLTDSSDLPSNETKSVFKDTINN